jgi:acetylornithine/succinyldiaminopimelate/putrescine aminotransferase
MVALVYFRGVRELCTKYNVLFIADEVQSGLGRSGTMLACDYDQVALDLLPREFNMSRLYIHVHWM